VWRARRYTTSPLTRLVFQPPSRARVVHRVICSVGRSRGGGTLQRLLIGSLVSLVNTTSSSSTSSTHTHQGAQHAPHAHIAYLLVRIGATPNPHRQQEREVFDRVRACCLSWRRQQQEEGHMRAWQRWWGAGASIRRPGEAPVHCALCLLLSLARRHPAQSNA
jgi:hypothetical protein